MLRNIFYSALFPWKIKRTIYYKLAGSGFSGLVINFTKTMIRTKRLWNCVWNIFCLKCFSTYPLVFEFWSKNWFRGCDLHKTGSTRDGGAILDTLFRGSLWTIFSDKTSAFIVFELSFHFWQYGSHFMGIYNYVWRMWVYIVQYVGI